MALPPRGLPVRPLDPPVLLTRQVWDVIAGAVAGDIADGVVDPSVCIPAVGAEVRYLPRLHALQSAGLPEYIRCFVHSVLLLADPVTLELLAEVTLSLHPPQHPLPAPPAAGVPIRFFSKAVSRSDVANSRVLVGKAGDQLFGGCTFRPFKSLRISDVFGTVYSFERDRYRLIRRGWREFEAGKAIRIGDRVVFLSGGRGLLIGLRRAYSPEEREMARAQDVLRLVERLDDGEPVTVTFYPGRSETFLVEREAEAHTPPAQVDLVDREEDEAPSIIILSSGSETEAQAHTPPAQVPVDREEDEAPSIIILSSGSETETQAHTPPAQVPVDREEDEAPSDDDALSCSIVSVSCRPLDPDFPVRTMRLTGIPVPRGLRLRCLEIHYTPLRGHGARRSGSHIRMR